MTQIGLIPVSQGPKPNSRLFVLAMPLFDAVHLIWHMLPQLVCYLTTSRLFESSLRVWSGDVSNVCKRGWGCISSREIQSQSGILY